MRGDGWVLQIAVQNCVGWWGCQLLQFSAKPIINTSYPWVHIINYYSSPRSVFQFQNLWVTKEGCPEIQLSVERLSAQQQGISNKLHSQGESICELALRCNLLVFEGQFTSTRLSKSVTWMHACAESQLLYHGTWAYHALISEEASAYQC